MPTLLIPTVRVHNDLTLSLIDWAKYGSVAMPYAAVTPVPPATLGPPKVFTPFEMPNDTTVPSEASPYFRIGDASYTVSGYSGVAIPTGATRMWCPVDANGGSSEDTTPKPRCEGREQKILNSTAGDWDITTGTRRQTGLLCVSRFSTPINGTSQSRTVFNQVHGKTPSTGLPIICMIRKANPSATVNTIISIIRKTPLAGAATDPASPNSEPGFEIPNGAYFGYESKIVNGAYTFKIAYPISGTPSDVFPYGSTSTVTQIHAWDFTTGGWAGGTNYAKAGNYVQEDASTHTGGIETIYKYLKMEHS